MRDICKDGRMPVNEIYRAFSKLGNLWVPEKITDSTAGGITLPINIYTTENTGIAAFLIAGHHGEETEGPIALAKSIESIRRLGEIMPVVLLPLMNPVGYATDWRYLRQKRWTKKGRGISANDAEPWLTLEDNGNKAKDDEISCQESFKVNNCLISLFEKYKPGVLIDFHGDEKAKGAYIYSHGKYKEQDRIALSLIDLFRRNNVPIATSTRTRWGEEINENGLVKIIPDGSTEDLFAANELIVNGRRVPGPSTETVLALELPYTLSLLKRVDVYRQVIASLPDLLQL